MHSRKTRSSARHSSPFSAAFTVRAQTDYRYKGEFIRALDIKVE